MTARNCGFKQYFFTQKDHELLRSMRDDPGLERKREEAFAKKEMWKNVLERCNSLNMFNK